MTRWLRQLQNEVIDLFFPRECIGCGKIDDFICIQCAKKLSRLVPPLCPKCGKPEASGHLCYECWGKSSNIDNVYSVFVFDGTMRKAVHSLKYHNLRAIAGCLGKYMASYYVANNLNGNILVPVPLHENRVRERGYNQSILLAREISRIVEIPVDAKLIKRTRDCISQARTKNVEERRRNMENAFSPISDMISGMEIILIDDVCTSGATLEACATVLKKAGASRVTGFTLAREINK
ncbi:MAG: ComF family protein [Dehalococcoidia bacterium]|nr:MAG: ComF family protein [Dehalococcoidia bacterium]